MNKLSVNELFSGIGAQRKALLNIGIDVDLVGISEIDKYAIQSYEAIFGKTRNYGDISKIERLDYADLWTYSFPCQSLSVAGKQEGIKKGTRSGLLLEVERLLGRAKQNGTLPKYLLLENVKNLVGKKFKPDFDNWLKTLDELGYNNYWQVLNAKDYGVPQNRERVFVVSIRKDIEQDFMFPEKEELKLRLKDVLEENVDEKYYLGDDKVKNLVESKFYLTLKDNEPSICASRGRNPENPSDRTVGAPTEQRFEINPNGVSNTLTTVQKDNYVVENKVIQVGNIMNNGKGWDNPQCGRVYDANGCSPTLNTMQGGNRQPKIIDDIYSNREPRVYDNYSPTLRAECQLRIRKLTPKECWRLMSFDDESFSKAQASGVSNSQLYKQAGNSIVVKVLERIFENLLIK